MKSSKIYFNMRCVLIIAMCFVSVAMMAQGAHPGTDPEGLSTPLDGGILMGILGGAGIVTIYIKNKRKNK